MVSQSQYLVKCFLVEQTKLYVTICHKTLDVFTETNQEKQTAWILKANQFLTVITEPIQWQVLVIWSDSIWVLDPSSASADNCFQSTAASLWVFPYTQKTCGEGAMG